MSLYKLIFGENPAKDVLVALLGLEKTVDPSLVDCFIRRDSKSKTQNPVASVKRDEKRITLGDDKAFITLIWYRKERVTPQLYRSIYFVDESIDSFDNAYSYLNYRVPYRFRDAVCPFATRLPYKIEDRFPALTKEMQKKKGKKVDPLTEFLLLKEKDLKEAIRNVLETPISSKKLAPRHGKPANRST